MLHERLSVLVEYVSGAVAGESTANVTSCFLVRKFRVIVHTGTARKDHEILRSLSALVASLPASEHPAFREEFDTVGRFSTS